MTENKPNTRIYEVTCHDDQFAAVALKCTRGTVTVSETRYTNAGGKLDRSNGPARIVEYSILPGYPVEEYYRCGQLTKRVARGFFHSEDRLYERMEKFFDEDEITENRGCLIERETCLDTLIVTLERWCYPNVRTEHREDGPAVIYRDCETGVTTLLKYSKHGQAHRDSDQGPAYVERNADTGLPLALAFYENGLRNNRRGPADIEFDPHTGTAIRSKWFLEGREVTDPSAITQPLLLRNQPFP